jgi:hypothetical protein
MLTVRTLTWIGFGLSLCVACVAGTLRATVEVLRVI